MAIHCHSARYHYDSFHSRGGDVINIGSNNTYNFGGAGIFGYGYGNSGNFWGGLGTSLGWSLGSGLMNWLGNGLSGGGWNPAGIFAGGSFGFGNGMGNFGMGMNPWSSFGWGGSTGRGGSASGTTSHNDCIDSDRQKINQIGSKVLNLQKNDKATRDDAVKLYNEIKKAKDDTNDIHKDTDTKDYDNWMNILNNYAKTKGWGDDLSKPAQEENTAVTTPTTVSTTATPVTQVADGSDVAGATSAAGATPTTENNFNSKLAAAGDDKTKLLALINDSSLTPDEKAKAKAKYAAAFGYANYNIDNDKGQVNKTNMKLVTDIELNEKLKETGKSGDITICTYVDPNGNPPNIIKMKTGKTEVTYKFLKNIEGEYIYESQHGNHQRYALQKNDSGYALVQYAYHDGSKIPDVTKK